MSVEQGHSNLGSVHQRRVTRKSNVTASGSHPVATLNYKYGRTSDAVRFLILFPPFHCPLSLAHNLSTMRFAFAFFATLALCAGEWPWRLTCDRSSLRYLTGSSHHTKVTSTAAAPIIVTDGRGGAGIVVRSLVEKVEGQISAVDTVSPPCKVDGTDCGSQPWRPPGHGARSADEPTSETASDNNAHPCEADGVDCGSQPWRPPGHGVRSADGSAPEAASDNNAHPCEADGVDCGSQPWRPPGHGARSADESTSEAASDNNAHPCEADGVDCGSQPWRPPGHGVHPAEESAPEATSDELALP